MLALMLVFGIYLGTFFSDDETRSFLPTKRSSNADKITQIISFIDREYVDTVAKNQMIEKAIASILED